MTTTDTVDNISKILTGGSLKQKLLLIAESRARVKFDKEGLITKEEIENILDGVRTTNENRLRDKFEKADRTLLNVIINLQGLMYEVKMHYSDLRGYILLWEATQTTEDLVNSILHEIKNPEERKRIAEAGAKEVDLLLSKAATDEEGFIEIDINFKKIRPEDPPLLELMNNVKEYCILKATKFISWRKATLDFMKETGFNVKTYKDVLDRYTEEIYSPIIGWNKYLSDEESFQYFRHNRVDKLKSRFSVTPKKEELKVDPELYNWFKERFLKK